MLGTQFTREYSRLNREILVLDGTAGDGRYDIVQGHVSPVNIHLTVEMTLFGQS